MQVGLIGAGNMARALARGWAEPVLCADPLPGRAAELASEVGGEALDSNRAVAERADVKAGLPAALATRMAIESALGSLELLRARDEDTLAVRRAVTSPGGITARGLAALERAGVRAAFVDAMDAVTERARS